jgi:hypothetical protein
MDMTVPNDVMDIGMWLRSTKLPGSRSGTRAPITAIKAIANAVSVVARGCLCGIVNRRSFDDSTYRYDSSSR